MTPENDKGNSGDAADPKNTAKAQADKQWEILNFIFDEPRPVILHQIAAQFKMPENETGHHVTVLKAGGFVRSELSFQIDGPAGFHPEGYVVTDAGRALVLSRRK